MLRHLGLSFSLGFSTLTLSQAQTRTRMIKTNSITYSSHLTLHKGNTYEGLTNITFQTQEDKNSNDPLRIDFSGNQVKSLLVNEHLIDNPSSLHQGGAIQIPRTMINPGQTNNVAVQYKNNYDQDGNGCVSFIDTDSKQYLYTQFQPYYANRVFPLFDQPNLKAPFELTIACPNDWQAVLSNQFQIKTPFRKIKSLLSPSYYQKYKKFTQRYANATPQDYKVTQFDPTLPLSSYLYCFVVGPYKELIINKNPKNPSVNIPMRLYSIESLYPQMVRLAPFIEQVTVQSMDFFQKYFGYKYPFSKYDQVFAHEYKWGAMENAGIVTFNDLYLFKDKVSNERMLSFGNTIVHQLSHHWFGNLVTMNWWDDLWLNESFAEYISHYCLQGIKKGLTTISYESAMLSFFTRKNWGYAEDELVTTHPIRGQVKDTFTAQSIFDGITYSKGAATMKQLMYLIGQESFSKALAAYFKQHEFSNAVLDDLLTSIQPYFDQQKNGLSLGEWKNMWLETAGTNTIACEWTSGKDTAVIVQGYDRSEHRTLRLHRIKVGIILNDHSLSTKEVTVLPQERTTVNIKIPQNAVAVLLNYDDYTFAKVEIDSQSRLYFQSNLDKLTDSVSRNLIWKSYFDMVKNCGITSQQFTSFCLKNLKKQKSDPIFEEQLSKLSSSITTYTPKIFRQTLYSQTFAFLQNQLLCLPETPQNANRKVIIKQKLIDFCHTQEHAQILLKWYNNKYEPFNHQQLNNTLRWKIVLRMFSRKQLNNNQKWQLFQNMKNRDSSDTMINKKIMCKSLSASPQELTIIYNKIFNKEEGTSLNNFVHQLGGFNQEIHENTINQLFFHRYFKDVKRMLGGQIAEGEKWFASGDYLEAFLTHFDPIIDGTIEVLQTKITLFKEMKTDNQKLKRLILKKIDVLERRVKTYDNCAKKMKK